MRLEHLTPEQLSRLLPPAIMKLGAAVIGLGVGEAHARAYAAMPECELRWVADTNAERARTLAAELGCQSATTFDPLLADSAVHIVSIASYDDAHAAQVSEALSRGKHVFVEKPIARTPDELKSVKTAWLRAGTHLSSNLVLRAAPLYQWLRDMIGGGRARRRSTPSTATTSTAGSRRSRTAGAPDVDDYSVMLGGGIHLVDLMLWLTGQRPHRVTAAGNRIATTGNAVSLSRLSWRPPSSSRPG